MTRQTNRPMGRTEAVRSVVAHRDIDRSRQTQEHKVLSLNINVASARSCQVSTWPGTTFGSSVEPEAQPNGWSADAATRVGPTRDGDCLDETGAICPRLAEARAGRALAERQLIELTHRQANVLQVLAGRIARQQSLQDNPAVQGELDRMVACIRASAQLHQYLLPPRKPAHVDLAALLNNLAVAIEGVTGLHCAVEAEAVAVPAPVATHLATAVNELAWNAYKHAYGAGAAGNAIRIVCRRDTDARLLISVADSGRGLPDGFELHASEGLGLMVVCATAQRFGGEVRAESNPGACFTLLLPIPSI